MHNHIIQTEVQCFQTTLRSYKKKVASSWLSANPKPFIAGPYHKPQFSEIESKSTLRFCRWAGSPFAKYRNLLIGRVGCSASVCSMQSLHIEVLNCPKQTSN